MKVLAGIDGTDRGDHAVAYACRILDAEKDDLWFYYSPPKVLPFTRLESGLTDLARDALTKAVFEKAEVQIPESLRPSVDARITGNEKPCDGILAGAKEVKADLIVIGAHSSSSRLTLFLGGSARSIAHRSEVPVLLVREKQESVDEGLRILVLCDQDDNWRQAALALSGFTWPRGSEVTLFHVVESMTEERVTQLAESSHPSIPNAASLIEEYQSSLSEQRAVRRQHLEGDRNDLPKIVKDASSKVVQGHVVDEVVREVRGQHIDLVVVGARRLGRVGRLLGSTTEALLSQCPCSLLIVHESHQA